MVCIHPNSCNSQKDPSYFGQALFPTSLCGVLVFDSVSRSSSLSAASLTHTQLCHTPSFTHNFVTHTQLCHTPLLFLSRTIFLCHTQLCHTQLCHTPSFTHTLVTHTSQLGVALGDIYLRLAWQAWHLWQWAGSGGALGRRSSPGAPQHFAWQARHLVTSTFHLRGRRGTCGTGLALVARLVAVVAPGRHLAWHNLKF